MLKTTERTVTCPDIHFQQDESMIQLALAAAPGIGLVEVDYLHSQVHFVTANQDGGEDVLARLDDAGFPATP